MPRHWKIKKSSTIFAKKIDDHPGWVATVTFYKALHVVEAMFAGDSTGPSHTDSHSIRNNVLKIRRFSHIWKNYQPLYTASLIARYLRSNENAPTYEVFSKFMPSDVVKNKVLNHYLIQIEKSAGNILGEPDFSAKLK